MKLLVYISIVLLLIQSVISVQIAWDIVKLSEVKKLDYTPKRYKVLSYTSSKEEIRQAVIEEFGHKMAKIVECESGFKLKAFNPHNKNGSTDSGLFQINSVHRKKAKEMGIDLDTIHGQFAYAKYLVKQNGYKDWVCAKKLGIVK